MALKQNIIYIYFKGKHLVTSKSQYQYNHGQFLYFADLDLPQAFEVHFSNRDKGESKTQIGSNKLVEIPDEYFWNGALQIYAWIYLHNQANDGETVYEVRIPLIKRAKPTDEEPLPVQQSAIDKAIAELATAVDITNENANKTDSDKTIVANIKDEVVILKENIDSTAVTINQKTQETIDASERAETSAQNAATSERKALDYVQQAEQSAQSALESKNIANQKAEIATDAATETLGYRNESIEAKDQAVQAKKNIVDYRDETKGYRDEAVSAKDDVQSLKEQVEDIFNTVGENAQSASQSASSASQSASSASQSASNASQSASQAEQFKDQSETNVTHYPKVIDGYWYVWDASNGEYVNTNVDARGTKGNDGEDGIFIDLISQIIPIAVDENGLIKSTTMTYGTSFYAYKGNERISFTCSVINSKVGNITVDAYMSGNNMVGNFTYKLTHGVIPFEEDDRNMYLQIVIDGQTYTRSITFTKIQDGIDGEDGSSGVYMGSEEPTDENVNLWVDTNGSPTGIINDVQVNGTSIVNNGVANIPIASVELGGVVRIADDDRANMGIGITEYGFPYLTAADDKDIKTGTVYTKRAILPCVQHLATFYGLAKSAGDTTQSASSNAIGNYTESAKSKISEMLGGSVSVSGTSPTIVAKSGIRYVCGEVVALDFTPPATGICDVVFTSGATATVLTVPSTIKWANGFDPTSLDANTTYELNIMDGLGVAVGWI